MWATSHPLLPSVHVQSLSRLLPLASEPRTLQNMLSRSLGSEERGEIGRACLRALWEVISRSSPRRKVPRDLPVRAFNLRPNLPESHPTNRPPPTRPPKGEEESIQLASGFRENTIFDHEEERGSSEEFSIPLEIASGTPRNQSENRDVSEFRGIHRRNLEPRLESKELSRDRRINLRIRGFLSCFSLRLRVLAETCRSLWGKT